MHEQPHPQPQFSAYCSTKDTEQLRMTLTQAMYGTQGDHFTIQCVKGRVDCTNWRMIQRRFAHSEITVQAGT